MDLKIPIDYLVKRAEEETANIQDKQMSRLSFMFASKDKIKQNQEEASESLGRIKMIKEMIEKFIDNK